MFNEMLGVLADVDTTNDIAPSSSNFDRQWQIRECKYDTDTFEREVQATRQAALAGGVRPFNLDNIKVTASTRPEDITMTTSIADTTVRHIFRHRPWYEPVAYWARRIVNPTVTRYIGNNPDLSTAFKGYTFIANPDRVILRIKFSNTQKHKSITTELEFDSLETLRSSFTDAVKTDLAKVFTDSECQSFIDSFNNAVETIRFKSHGQFSQFR